LEAGGVVQVAPENQTSPFFSLFFAFFNNVLYKATRTHQFSAASVTDTIKRTARSRCTHLPKKKKNRSIFDGKKK
jgi:hypothetical protein